MPSRISDALMILIDVRPDSHICYVHTMVIDTIGACVCDVLWLRGWCLFHCKQIQSKPFPVLPGFPQKAAEEDVLISPRPVVQLALTAGRPKRGVQAGSHDAFDLAAHTKMITLPRSHQNGETLSFSVVGECCPA